MSECLDTININRQEIGVCPHNQIKLNVKQEGLIVKTPKVQGITIHCLCTSPKHSRDIKMHDLSRYPVGALFVIQCKNCMNKLSITKTVDGTHHTFTQEELNAVCEICLGNGGIKMTGIVRCTACEGMGGIRCSSCHGSGGSFINQQMSVGYIPTTFSKWEQCTKCLGTKYSKICCICCGAKAIEDTKQVFDIVCKTCKGLGTYFIPQF